MEIRLVTSDDLPALTDIYNHDVRHSPATFDEVAFTVDARRAWFEHYRTPGPHRLFLAAESDIVVGYVTSSVFRPKPGYGPVSKRPSTCIRSRSA